jgi:hypothetical protein
MCGEIRGERWVRKTPGDAALLDALTARADVDVPAGGGRADADVPAGGGRADADVPVR